MVLRGKGRHHSILPPYTFTDFLPFLEKPESHNHGTALRKGLSTLGQRGVALENSASRFQSGTTESGFACQIFHPSTAAVPRMPPRLKASFPRKAAAVCPHTHTHPLCQKVVTKLREMGFLRSGGRGLEQIACRSYEEWLDRMGGRGPLTNSRMRRRLREVT
jgi:hypothetical protein